MTKDSVKTKQVILRAFKIKCSDTAISKAEPNFLNLLSQKLNDTVVNDRRMQLNQQDIKKEEDFISYYDNNETSLFATLLRITPSGDVAHISKQLFSEKIFTLNQLTDTKTNFSAVYRSHFYFYLNENFLITNLPRNRTITCLQAYINWLLGVENLELNPMILPPSNTKLSDLKNIKFKDPFFYKDVEASHQKHVKITDQILNNVVSKIFKDINSLKDIDLKQIISAEIILKLKKPKSMTEEEYQKTYGAYLKPISDIENVSFRDKKGNLIKSEDILKTKSVEIEITETEELSEPQLKQEMATFIKEL